MERKLQGGEGVSGLWNSLPSLLPSPTVPPNDLTCLLPASPLSATVAVPGRSSEALGGLYTI